MTDIHIAKIITAIIKRKIVLIELNRQPTHNIIQITILRIIKNKIVTKLQNPNVRALRISQNRNH